MNKTLNLPMIQKITPEIQGTTKTKIQVAPSVLNFILNYSKSLEVKKIQKQIIVIHKN